MLGWTASAWPVVVVLAACVVWNRFSGAAGKVWDDGDWNWRVDPFLALGVGAAYAWLAGVYFPPFHLQGGDYVDVDFPGYCRSLGAMRDGIRADWGVKHSVMAGWLLSGPTRVLGVLGTLALGSIVSGGFFGMGLYLWGRVAAGRLAGLWVVAFALANQNLTWLSRSLSFYPETTAACVLGIAGVAAGLRWRTMGGLWASGIGCALILASDVRFFNIGCWTVFLWLVAYVGMRPRNWSKPLVALVVPLSVSWLLSNQVHGAILGSEIGPGAVRQAALFLGDMKEYPQAVAASDVRDSDFVWGVHAPWRAPRAFLKLLYLSSFIPDSVADKRGAVEARTWYLYPWLPLAGAAATGALCLLPRRPWTFVAALAPTLPFFANLYLVFHTLPHGRHFPLGMSALPILLGVGLAAAGGRAWGAAAGGTTTGLLVLNILGVVPGFLSPVAEWRVPETTRNRVYDAYARASGLPPVRGLENEWPTGEDCVECVDALKIDVAAGKVWMPYSDAPRSSVPVSLP